MKPSALILVNFRYGTHAKPLKSVAYSQLAAKALLLAGKSQSEGQITIKVADILGLQNVSRDLVKSGLSILLKEKIIETTSGGKWVLTETAKKKFDVQVNSMEVAHNEVLADNFPPEIEAKKLEFWFSQASADFFGHFSEEWVTSVAQGNKLTPPSITPLAELLKPSIENAGLQEYRQALVNGYLGFLRSTKPTDQESLMNMGLAAFSAQLVSADLGADPVGLVELTGAKFYLDTNILVAIALDDPRVKVSIDALAKALITIKATLIYTPRTRDEYRGLIHAKKQAILKRVGFYGKDVLDRLYDNDFYVAAVKVGCKTVEDFERFFAQIENVPDTLGEGTELVLEEDNVTEAAAELAIKDTKLKSTIQHAYLNRPHQSDRADTKSDISLEHDAVLIHAVKAARADGLKCWALSMDHSLQIASLSVVRGNDVPPVMGFDTFIELLALDTMGPGYDPSNFAPLLMNMLLSKSMPHKDAYRDEDFQIVADIIETSNELPPEELEAALRLAKKHRMSGSKADDDSLRLELNRINQKSNKEILRQNEESKEQIKRLIESANAANSRAEKTEKILSKLEELRNNNRAFAKSIAKRSVVGLGVGLIFYIIFKHTPETERYSFWLGLITFLITSVGYMTSPITAHIAKQKALHKEVDDLKR